MWELLGSLGGSALGLIGGWINRGYNERRQDYLMDKQFGQTKELMNMQNVYNSPKSQMSRLKEAGLNPNLIYGGGSAVMASAGGYASSPSPQGNGPIDTQGVLQMVNLIVNSMLEKDRISAQKDLQSEQLQSTKELQESSLAHQAEQGSLNRESSEKMASATLQENQRQFNERIAEEIRQFNLNYEQAEYVAKARLNLDNYLASLKGSETASKLKLDNQAYAFNDLLNGLSARLKRNEFEVAQFDAVMNEIVKKASLGIYFTKEELIDIFASHGVSYNDRQLDNIISYLNIATLRMKTENDINSKDFIIWMRSIFGYVKDGLSTAAALLTKIK